MLKKRVEKGHIYSANVHVGVVLLESIVFVSTLMISDENNTKIFFVWDLVHQSKYNLTPFT